MNEEQSDHCYTRSFYNIYYDIYNMRTQNNQ